MYRYIASILLNINFPSQKSWLATAALAFDFCCERLQITPTVYKNKLGNLLWSKPTSTHLQINLAN